MIAQESKLVLYRPVKVVHDRGVICVEIEDDCEIHSRTVDELEIWKLEMWLRDSRQIRSSLRLDAFLELAAIERSIRARQVADQWTPDAGMEIAFVVLGVAAMSLAGWMIARWFGV